MKDKNGENIEEKTFKITSLCKDDIRQAFNDVGRLTPKIKKKIDAMTDSEMSCLASDMADDYCNQLFWDSLRIIFEDNYLEDD